MNQAVRLIWKGCFRPQTFLELRQITQDKVRDLAIQLSGMHGRPVSDIIAAAKKMIDDNYAGNISLESIADSIALSPHYFSRLFSSQVGKLSSIT